MSAIRLEQSVLRREPGPVRLVALPHYAAEDRSLGEAPSDEGHPNPIVRWVIHRGCDLAAYLDHLLQFDQRMGGEVGTPFTLARVRRRLALALFLDFARAQGLSADEMASLMKDAQQTASEAMSFLISAAKRAS
jgi:hypothetical protein